MMHTITKALELIHCDAEQYCRAMVSWDSTFSGGRDTPWHTEFLSWSRDQIQAATAMLDSFNPLCWAGIKPASPHSPDAADPTAPQRELQYIFVDPTNASYLSCSMKQLWSVGCVLGEACAE